MDRIRWRVLRNVVCGMTLMLTAGAAKAETVTWVGGTSSDWGTADNWDAGGTPKVPVSGDDVVVDGATTYQPTLDLSGGAVTIASLAIGATNTSILTFSYGDASTKKLIVTGNATIAANGTLTHGDNASAETHKLNLQVGGDLTIAAWGEINVDYLGYDVRQGDAGGGSNYGASHGGSGGAYNGTVKPVYGSITEPTRLGSGGSGGGNPPGGGGVILTVAGTTTHNGLITARGGTSTYGGGGGSGGAIFLTTGTLAGNGTNRVNGGHVIDYYGGGGGGGRIALIVTAGTDFGSVVNEAIGGDGCFGGNSWDLGGGAAGTVFLKKSGDANGMLSVDNNDEPRGGYYTDLPSGTHQFDAIRLTNAGRVRVASGSTLDMSGGTSLSTDVDNARLIAGEGILLLPTDFTIANAVLSFTGTSTKTWTTNLTVASTGLLTHESISTTVLGEYNKLVLTINGDLTIDSGGKITADKKGYAAGQGPLPGSYHYGAGHGGRGGIYSGTSGDALYGSITAPDRCGSGGSSSSGNPAGGGAINLTVTGATTNNGLITACGGDSESGGRGGGAGGSVFLATGTFAGTGAVVANGGDCLAYYGGGGGGGRIAVVLTSGTDFGSVTEQAYGGIGSFGNNPDERFGGGAGTVYLKTATESYGQLIIDNNNRMATSAHAQTIIGPDVGGKTVGDVVVRSSAKLVLYPNQTLTCYGDWSNSATLDAQDMSTVLLAGAASTAVNGDNRFYNLTCAEPGKTLTFEAGKTQTVAAYGLLTLEGADAVGNELTLQSSLPGTTWKLTLEANGLQAVSYVAVKDSDALGGQKIVAPTGVDNGNNYNWDFSSGGTVTWTGTTSTAWDVATNWDGGSIPSSLDTVIVPDVSSASGNFPELVANVEIAGLTVEIGATLSLTGNNLTVNGGVDNSGTIAASAAEIFTIGGDADFTGGAYSAAASRLILAGTTAQAFSSGGNSFNGIVVENIGGIVSFMTGLTTEDFACSSPGASLIFADGAAYNVTNLVLQGASGNLVTLRSAGGAAWNLNVSGWHAVQYVDVQDSDAGGGTTIYASDSTHDGSNVNWVFSTWKSWNGSVSGDWAAAGNWTPTGVPVDSDSVRIDGNGANAPVLSVATTVAQLVVGPVTATTLTINKNLTVTGDVTFGPAATITHTGPGNSEGNRVILTVGGDLALAEQGVIDVVSKGFNVRTGPGTAGGNDAGSHGGHGTPLSGICYGSIAAPTRWGSGGHSSPGGGAVQLDVTGTTTLDGSILADANNGDHYPGAGGSVYVRTGELQGSGRISANGGSGVLTTFGSGGGGRIAVVLTGGISFGNVTWTAYDGEDLSEIDPAAGAAGTIYLRAAGDTYGNLIVNNGDSASGNATLISTDVTDTEVGDVEVGGNAHLKIGAAQTLTVHGDWSNSATTSSESGGSVVLAGSSSGTVSGSNTFANLDISVTDKTVSFEAGAIQTINGTPTFDNNVTLQSATPGTQWNLVKPGTGTQPVGLVQVRDSNAGSGMTFEAGVGATDLGNNSNWEFPKPVVNSFVVTDNATGDHRSTTGTVDIEIEASPSNPGGSPGGTVTGYMVTETDVEPAPGDSGWGTSSSITGYTITGSAPDGWVTLYAWVKDDAGAVGGASAAIYYYDSINSPPELVGDPTFTATGSNTVEVSWETTTDAVGEIRCRKTYPTGQLWTYGDGTSDVGTLHTADMTVEVFNNYEVYLICNGTEFGPYYYAVDKPGRAAEDVNGDGFFNTQDLTFVRNRINRDLNAENNWSADVNGDGRINILDMVRVRNAMQ